MSFDTDNAWQRGIRDRILAPNFYREHATDGRYVFIDKGKLATLLQKQFAVDTILQGSDGAAVCIEEKLVRWKGKVYSKFFLETKSNTNPGHEAPGWMVYGKADYLLYGFVQEGEQSVILHLIDFPGLVAWFWPIHERYEAFVMPYTFNHTEGRLVPIVDVQANVKTWRFNIGNDTEERIIT
jgi:hypothetical protein